MYYTMMRTVMLLTHAGLAAVSCLPRLEAVSVARSFRRSILRSLNRATRDLNANRHASLRLRFDLKTKDEFGTVPGY